MKKNLLPLLLVVVAVAIFFLLRKPSDEVSVATEFTALIEDATRAPDPAATGSAWPSEDEMARLREEWHALGSADSTVLAQLTPDWMYRESGGPFRMTNITQVRAGQHLTIQERLRIGEILAAHPKWRLGTMRFFPAAAAVLSPKEKSVLNFMARSGGEGPVTEARIIEGSGLSAAVAAKTLAGLTSVGWVFEPDSTGFVLANPRIADGGALNYLTFKPSQGRAFDVVSMDAAIRHHPKVFASGRVQLIGTCTRTGRPIEIDIIAGRLSSGRPGQAYAVETKAVGLTNGLFSSEKEFEAWKAEHPDVETGSGSTIPGYFHRLLADSQSLK